MASEHGKQIIAIHVMPNISRSKVNQTMKFGQLVEQNMGNIMWWRIIVCTLPLSAGGVDHPTKFSKKMGGKGA